MSYNHSDLYQQAARLSSPASLQPTAHHSFHLHATDSSKSSMNLASVSAYGNYDLVSPKVECPSPERSPSHMVSSTDLTSPHIVTNKTIIVNNEHAHTESRPTVVSLSS